MTSKGYGFTQGKCLITAQGSYMLIDKNNSPIEMSNQSDKKLFADLSSGDEILVLHDGIQESYPARTSAYYCKKLSDGKAEDVPQSVIESLTEMGWLQKEIKGTRVECIGEDYNFSITIPDDWEYETETYTIEVTNKTDNYIVLSDNYQANEIIKISDGTENIPDGPIIFAHTHQGLLDNFAWIPATPKHSIALHSSKVKKILVFLQEFYL